MGRTVTQETGDDPYPITQRGVVEEIILSVFSGGEARILSSDDDTESRPESGMLIQPGETWILRPAKLIEKELHAITSTVDFEIDARQSVPKGVPGSNPDVDYVEPHFRPATTGDGSMSAKAKNQSGIVGDTITPGTGGATFSSQEVPDGFSVVVQNQHGSDTVYIQDDGGTDRHQLQNGESVAIWVDNLDAITVTGTANNPTVTATVESP